MNKETVKKRKWFWAWEDEKEEAWLTECSASGLHLVKPDVGIYEFMSGSPKRYIYRLDYQTHSKKDKEQYLQLFHDSGWEHVGEMNGWQYFRKEAIPGEEPQIYTDPASKAEKYRRLMGFFLLMMPIYSSTMITIAPRSSSSPAWGIIQAAMFIVLMLYIYFMFKLWARIRQLTGRAW